MNEIKKINVGGVDYDIVAKELTKTTYTELKALRDNGQLSEGHLYRITDYVTTTTQAETKSAGNVFDVIVLAVSSNELSHIARAIQHEGDTYFDGNDLGAWELWYDLDNDTEKYEWADATNGKGVIYRMIDDKANDCPYDFKNILFYNTKYTYNTTEDNYYYTFSYVVPDKLYDGTVEKRVKFCYANSMGARIDSSKRKLLFNVFHCTAFGNSCSNNTFGNSCYYNTFGNYCYYNTFGNYRGHNTFRNYSDGYKVEPTKTMSEEFYDDGSGKLVPVKHPDLSTQPSILPYKFMGQYVYEQLVFLGEYDVENTKISTEIPCQAISVSNPLILRCDGFGYGKYIKGESQTGSVIRKGITGMPIDLKLTFIQASSSDNIFRVEGSVSEAMANMGVEIVLGINPIKVYAHIVYTSMPEEGGYYGYNNY